MRRRKNVCNTTMAETASADPIAVISLTHNIAIKLKAVVCWHGSGAVLLCKKIARAPQDAREQQSGRVL